VPDRLAEARHRLSGIRVAPAHREQGDLGVEADDLHQVGHDDLHDGGDTIGV